MNKIQVKALQKILEDHISLLGKVKIQNFTKAVDSGDLENPDYKTFMFNTELKVLKAEEILMSLKTEFNLVNELEEEECE